MSTGVRCEFVTDARGIQIEMVGSVDSSPVDVEVDGVRAIRQQILEGSNLFELTLPEGEHLVAIWWPQFGMTSVGLFSLSDASSVRSNGEQRPRWLSYGSSITQCRTADGPSETWPALVARKNAWDLTCLGFGSECHLDDVVARHLRDTKGEMISLCIGINIYGAASLSRRTLGPRLVGFIDRIRERQPTIPIAVISPIFSGTRESTPNNVGLTLDGVRGVVVHAVQALQSSGDDATHLIDGRDLFSLEDDPKLMPDGLHPNQEGYALMAERIAPRLRAVYDAALAG
ncbi:hypothetical protein ASC63_03465 [Leifsonia sp. Root112D2]|nr:hypothetical protein ASC63_03465 [Leifsonia sp. Root112D2]